MDFKSLAAQFDPARIILYLNEIIDTFDKIDENYDVFKVESKADASYMVVAGLSDRSHIGSCEPRVSQVATSIILDAPCSLYCSFVVTFVERSYG